MNAKQFFKEIPKLPLSALLFYILAFLLWNINLIPPPAEIIAFLESLYLRYGLIGLSIATFLEGIVYLGLYFPGSFIIALSVFLADGSLFSLFSISLVVTLTLTLTAVINYSLGRRVILPKGNEGIKHKNVSKGLLLSMIHPNFLAFYFFHAGIEKHKPWKIALVPVVMLPYGLFLAVILSTFKVALKSKLESPYIMITFILIWLTFAFIVGHLSKKRRKQIYGELD